MRLEVQSTRQEKYRGLLGAGCSVVFQSSPELSATYGLDATTLNQIQSVASDAANGLGLPFGADYFVYPDITNQPMMFDATEIQQLYQALRDYVATLQYYGTGQIDYLPPQPVVIP